jgi:hypothetical protein
MSTAPTCTRGPMTAVLIAFLVLFALFGAAAAAVLVLGTSVRVQPAAVQEAR